MLAKPPHRRTNEGLQRFLLTGMGPMGGVRGGWVWGGQWQQPLCARARARARTSVLAHAAERGGDGAQDQALGAEPLHGANAPACASERKKG